LTTSHASFIAHQYQQIFGIGTFAGYAQTSRLQTKIKQFPKLESFSKFHFQQQLAAGNRCIHGYSSSCTSIAILNEIAHHNFMMSNAKYDNSKLTRYRVK
jgi:hypothetical protein